MEITEDDFNSFIKEWDEIAGKYPIVLKNRTRFNTLSRDKSFIEENNKMYSETTFFIEPEFSQLISKEDLSNFLIRFKDFVDKWKTRPVSCWLFTDYKEGLKERMEEIFDVLSQYQVVKVYPWTTKEEIKAKFDGIRKIDLYWPLRPEQYSGQLKIRAFRDGGWKYREITEYLRSGGESDREFEARMIKRENNLRNQGKTEKEIEKILNNEFTFQELDYDTVRKRGKAANDLCEKILSYILKSESK